MALQGQHGRLNKADGELWAALEQPMVNDASEQLRVVRMALDNGANPNLGLREFQNFRYTVGIATFQQRPELVETLLSAGGLAQWPDEGSNQDIDAEELTGEPDVSYHGRAVDPLFIAFDDLGWLLAQASMQSKSQLLFQAQILRQIIDSLLAAGAILRCDPAMGLSPLDYFLQTLAENTSLHTDYTVPLAAEVLFETLLHADPSTPGKIMSGHWDELPTCPTPWAQDLPDILTHLIGLAEQTILEKNTAASEGSKGDRL